VAFEVARRGVGELPRDDEHRHRRRLEAWLRVRERAQPIASIRVPGSADELDERWPAEKALGERDLDPVRRREPEIRSRVSRTGRGHR